MGTLKIELLGTSFSIESKEDSVYLEKLLEYYRNVTEDVEKVATNSDKRKIAILSGLMLCDELFKEKVKRHELHTSSQSETNIPTSPSIELDEVEKRTLKMIDDIDRLIS